MRPTAPVLIVLAASCAARGQQGPDQPATPLDWKTLEAPFLTDHVQLTSRDMFVKAGEAYFDPGTTWIVFQAVPVPEGDTPPDDFYSMYTAKLVKSPEGAITGIEKPIRISPPGSWNSCAWFHPKQPWEIIFSSTLTTPATDQKGGFQVGQRRYTWLFPEEAEIVGVAVPQIFADISRKPVPGGATRLRRPETVFSLPDYQAECSFSPDGRFILYAGAAGKDPNGRTNIDIFVYDTRTETHKALVQAPGYDGGPFFSPDGKWICYRSDRKLNDLLQIYIAELKFGADGAPTGIAREIQLTENDAVNWAPFWHPSGRYLIYGTSEMTPQTHANYEVFAVEADPEKPIAERRRRRITFANGADVLPVFNSDGSWMMWTAQRGPAAPGETKPSSQLWAARVNGGAGLFQTP
jgi:TolB protein